MGFIQLGKELIKIIFSPKQIFFILIMNEYPVQFLIKYHGIINEKMVLN